LFLAGHQALLLATKNDASRPPTNIYSSPRAGRIFLFISHLTLRGQE